MIKITYSSREPLSLILDGHSNYAEYGKDIVCASISVLFQTLANALEEYTSDNISMWLSSGNCHIIWNGHQSAQARLITGVFVDGMSSVACTYPDYVQVKIE